MPAFRTPFAFELGRSLQDRQTLFGTLSEWSLMGKTKSKQTTESVGRHQVPGDVRERPHLVDANGAL